MEKLIGFELRGQGAAPSPMRMPKSDEFFVLFCVFPLTPPLLSRYDGVKMSTFHQNVALIGSLTQLASSRGGSSLDAPPVRSPQRAHGASRSRTPKNGSRLPYSMHTICTA